MRLRPAAAAVVKRDAAIVGVAAIPACAEFPY